MPPDGTATSSTAHRAAPVAATSRVKPCKHSLQSTPVYPFFTWQLQAPVLAKHSPCPPHGSTSPGGVGHDLKTCGQSRGQHCCAPVASPEHRSPDSQTPLPHTPAADTNAFDSANALPTAGAAELLASARSTERSVMTAAWFCVVPTAVAAAAPPRPAVGGTTTNSGTSALMLLLASRRLSNFGTATLVTVIRLVSPMDSSAAKCARKSTS